MCRSVASIGMCAIDMRDNATPDNKHALQNLYKCLSFKEIQCFTCKTYIIRWC